MPRGSALFAVCCIGVFGGEVIGDRLGDVAEDVELLAGEQVGKTVPNGRQVRWGGGLDRRQTGIGEHHVEAARIVCARGSLDGAAGFHTRDLMRETAAFPAQPATEVAGAQPTPWRFGNLNEHSVVGLGKPAFAGEFAREMGGQLVTHALKTPPGAALAPAQRSRLHNTILAVDMSK